MSNNVKEASDMLAAALEQMDGLLAGTTDYENGIIENGNSPTCIRHKMHTMKANRLMEELRAVLEGMDDMYQVIPELPQETRNFFKNWLRQSTDNKGWCDADETDNYLAYYRTNGLPAESVEDKLRKLETERESLALQVSVLSDQVEAQSEKIRDLETSLSHTDNSFEHELLSRTNLETHKLDLMAEISALKLKLATSEKARCEYEQKLTEAQKRIDDLQVRLNDKTIEVNELRNKGVKNGTIPSLEQTDPNRSLERDRTFDKDKTLDRLRRKHSEVERLKKVVESLMTTNTEKDKHIDEMGRLLKKYHRLEDMMVATQGRKCLEGLGLDDDHSDASSTQNSTSSNENTVRDHYHYNDRPMSGEYGENHNLGHHRVSMPDPSATSTPVSCVDGKPPLPHMRSPPSVITSLSFTPKRPSDSLQRSNSAEDMTPVPSKTPPTMRKNGQGYGTLPASLPVSPSSRDSSPVKSPPSPGTPAAQAHPPSRKNRVLSSFGKGFLKFKSGKWSSSAPNLVHEHRGCFSDDDEAKTEDEEEALKDEMARQYKAMQTNGGAAPQYEYKTKKHKGIKRFFGKLRRSNSQDMDSEGLESFRRNGLRSTAGPRLGWSKDTLDPELPFSRWDSDRVSSWMHAIGLSMYVGDCKRWIKNGAQLSQASPADLEKELGMRNPFHRKKLQLALQAQATDSSEPVDELDHNWVTRWLDDIGLPQYKDQFLEARIDGRMLHLLTVDDLVGLRITNSLHHLSIRRGIQVLRKHKFNPTVLKRRPAADDCPPVDCPEEVNLWTNHRVMEWLRTIDLSEYAPNLRGSGVHGGLMVLEPRFGAELFASILSIPASKTLLRRHLSTHFVTLIGTDVQHGKRTIEQSSGYVPLTPNQKVKSKKFGLFIHKRTRSSSESDDFLCPIDGLPSDREAHTNGGPVGAHRRDGSLTRQQSLPRQPAPDMRKNQDKHAVKEIGAVSQEINSLTHMLARDKFFEDVPSSNV